MEEEEGAGTRLREGSDTRTMRKEARASRVDEEEGIGVDAGEYGDKTEDETSGNQRDFPQTHTQDRA